MLIKNQGIGSNWIGVIGPEYTALNWEKFCVVSDGESVYICLIKEGSRFCIARQTNWRASARTVRIASIEIFRCEQRFMKKAMKVLMICMIYQLYSQYIFLCLKMIDLFVINPFQKEFKRTAFHNRHYPVWLTPLKARVPFGNRDELNQHELWAMGLELQWRPFIARFIIANIL